MGRTTKYLLIGAVVLAAAYFLFSKPSATGKAGSTTTSGWGGLFTGIGNAGTGLGKLWGSIFGSSDTSAPVDTTTSSTGDN